MILIFGGTTEGRRAVSVCDEASRLYYYSTRTEGQHIDGVYAIRVTGDLDESGLTDFCRRNAIRLMIDAAHPFAENLHRNIATVSEILKIPVICFERNYPERTSDIQWFDTYEEVIAYLEEHTITRLLALTGVNTIRRLKRYWERQECLFRILDRDFSRNIAALSGFPPERIVYSSEQEDEFFLFKRLAPGAILIKESGDSGRFTQKISAARALHIPVLAIKRPLSFPFFIPVTGENSLRREIETRLPDFFELRTGVTTGTCATAASKVALIALLSGEFLSEVVISLPDGEQISIPVSSVETENGTATAVVIKDAGDDPDVTHGLEIVSTVRLTPEHRDVRFLQGGGVGTVTLPGLGLEIGDPAINPIPRRMIRQEVSKVLRSFFKELRDQEVGVDVTLSVPKGREIAEKTFNPKLGILGGISIIGTSGIVRPFSSDAFLESIRREIDVAHALHCERIVMNSGAKSERFMKSFYPELLPQAFIHFGNFVGETIRFVSGAGFCYLTLGIMIGKAVKLAEGALDTHSKTGVMNTGFLIELAREAGCSRETQGAIRTIHLARQLWEVVPETESVFFERLAHQCAMVCSPLLPGGELTLLLMDDTGALRYKVKAGTNV